MDLTAVSYAIFKGFCDSFKGFYTAFVIDKEITEKKLARRSPSRLNSVRQKHIDSKEKTAFRLLPSDDDTIRDRVVNCAILNGVVFLASIIFFEYIFFPSLNIITDGTWMVSTIYIFYSTFWLIPMCIISKILSAFYFQDIATDAYRHNRGRPVYQHSLSRNMADWVFSLLIQILFLLQITAVSYIPIQVVGYVLSQLQMCILYSLYSFEYKWFNMGWELHKRLSFLETHWPYFLGFGFPLAFLTQISSFSFVNGGIFSLFFPFLIISGTEASPVLNSDCTPIHFFAPVVWISNKLFSVFGSLRS